MVYVDDFNMPFKGMIMCHMNADTSKELLDMATKIGLSHKYIQYPGTPQEHFDVSLSMKKKAISFGAKEMKARDLSEIVMNKIINSNNN